MNRKQSLRQAWERTGLEINFREGIDRVREAEKAQKNRARSPGKVGSAQLWGTYCRNACSTMALRVVLREMAQRTAS